MFSIAAINESEASKQWEPLAPTKEAQEFYLTQKYHEALLKLQAKELTKARELLEQVLKDPIISNIQSDKDHLLLQLRFLSLKNLASVFFQQGSEHYESALHCYLQAVELDSNDSVVWNRLGTLSCSIGSFTTARWAFEQGLKCSPNNWNCMEKLLEVLIAIGDEVSCLSISNRILKHWPSHSRALYVKKAIESVETGKNLSRGIDKLEPKHPSLNLKRKSIQDNNNDNIATKKSRQEIDVQLVVPTWSALLDSILTLLKDPKGEISTHNRINITLNTNTSQLNESDCTESKLERSNSNSKEKERDPNSNTDKEPQSQERRSSRLERLRSRKSGKEDPGFETGKEIRNSISQILEPFILKQSSEKTDSSSNCNKPLNYPDVSSYTAEMESSDVKQFVEVSLNNSGAVHLGHLLLEEFADLEIPYKDYFVKILELEKLTRQWGKERTPLCSLFLAEIYFDHGFISVNRSKRSEFLADCSYHLCKVIEQAALEIPAQRDINELLLNEKIDNMVVNDTPVNSPNGAEMEGGERNDNINININGDGNNEINLEKPDGYWAFWARFFWLSGNLSLSSGSKGKAHDELNFSISLLREIKKDGEFGYIFLPHCKNVRVLTKERIVQEINMIKLDSLLRDNEELIKKISHSECLELLPPLLFSSKDMHKESRRVLYLEISALDLLMSACEKEQKMNVKLYLQCLKRKLQLLTIAAGLDKILSDSNSLESIKAHRVERVIGIIRDISANLTRVKLFIDQNNSFDAQDESSSLICIISDIQLQLLAIVRSSFKLILMRKSSSDNNNNSGRIESNICLVDSAILFCKLQHLDPSVSIKTQVDLIVGVHDLLAEHGLCCAGKDNKGEEGLFLKFAIKHLLALDVKLKSLHNTNGTEDDEQDSKENEMEEIEASIDSALDQNFFCLYGLNMNPDSNSEEDLAIHKNTNRGEYQTKEQCADVFQYILPYAKALSRSGLVKLRRVLRAIHKHFPQPPNEVLSTNAIDKFLDGSDLCEKKLLEIYETKGNNDDIINILFPDELSPDSFKKLSVSSSEPYMEVYSNIYYYVAQAEDTSATDKYPGFVLKKEGEEFVEHNANLFKYDLLYNPKRFESWQKLAYIYDEEVDLLLNDGAKHMSISDWKKNTVLQQRVQAGRRRSRRCLLFSLALANSPSDESQINELLALVYYDSLQNVVPFYDQRSVVPTKDSTWTQFCHLAMKHFEKAFALKPEWLHAFYLGKLCEKLGHSPAKAFSHYTKAAELNPTAVDPFYRLHASRVKLLYTQGKNPDIIKVVARYAFKESAKETVLNMFEWKSDDLIISEPNEKEISDFAPDSLDSEKQNSDFAPDSLDNENQNSDFTPDSLHNEKQNSDFAPDSLHNEKQNSDFAPDLLDKAWHLLYEDGLAALRICVEGELKHFHKGRFKIAQGLYRRGIKGDLDKARDELAFCFKSSRSSFTVNLWEIDGMVRKGRKKNVSVSGNRKSLEVSLSESSRKFITCIRKYILLYLNLLQGTADLATLERAYNYLRTDRRFYLCISDMIPVSLGKYIQALTSAIRNSNDSTCTEQLLEKMFNSFMDHASLWAEIGSLHETNSPDLSETNLHSYIHQYIKLLESEIRLEQLESINERIRKRFKSPKLSSNTSLSKILKHASLSWCRCLLIKLALITPIPHSDASSDHADITHDIMLYADLQPEELLLSSPEGPVQSRGLDMNLFETLSKIKNLKINQVSDDKMETAVCLMRSCYSFYRESSCGNFPAGINLYTVLGSHVQTQVQEVIGILDVSVPRKLLLWAYTVVNGRYCNIASVVKYCEEMKLRTKKGQQAIPTTPVPALPQAQQASSVINNTTVTGGGKEKVDESAVITESGQADVVVKEKPSFGLQNCSSSKSMEKFPEEESAGNINNSN